ncbi:MAG: ethanolamine utilization protein EutN, partial [Deltaproteobacteria bacterium]|nr:ethanolamine utilization protein EutN [Deltaproteobacteria bacterium]
ALGAGPGELVLTAHGSRCRDLTLGEHTPTKELVIAIVDGATVGDITLARESAR